ncbi:DNA-binding protein [Ketobacter alkanivorans]|jgi:chromosome segregation ATPase|uniref:Chromosome partitioning protein ParA n=1 Tax=Ketobacter alkanivorans TaxID=1917421 RepID=A0A2K9LF86_9GAMM|nr:DNA-binding protein [Ketobacter alkanivorans]AUM11028.1 chromosome partitioning protein ParA [Ketobacter alkanivorans]
MARAGVTYIDIAKAAEAIKSHGQEPTVDRIRERLGTGSKSTIAPLLKRWRSHNTEATDISGLPNDLVEVVKSLHERVQQVANHKIEQARKEYQAANENLQAELTEARNTITQLTARQQDLEQQNKGLIDEKTELYKALEDTRINLVKAESQRDEALTRVAELKAAVSDLKQENRDIRNHFEHYQQRTAEDRQHEREQFRAANQQLQSQVHSLSNQLAQSESHLSELLKANTQLQTMIDGLNESNHALQLELNQKNETMKSLNHNLEATLAEHQTSSRQNDELREKIAALTSRLSAADKENYLLAQALEKAEAELGSTKDKVAFLAEENKVILQEKAVIQGQFKQLQSSL